MGEKELPLGSETEDQAKRRTEITKLVTQAYVLNDDESQKARIVLESMGLDLTKVDRRSQTLSQIITQLLENLDELENNKDEK